MLLLGLEFPAGVGSTKCLPPSLVWVRMAPQASGFLIIPKAIVGDEVVWPVFLGEVHYMCRTERTSKF